MSTESTYGSQSYVFSSSCVDVRVGPSRRIYVFELWCWKRLLKAPWTARRWNQSILKEINPEYSLEGLMLKLRLQYFGHQMWRADSLEKDPDTGKAEDKRRRGWQRMRWLESITDSMDMNLSKLWETVKDRGAWHATVHGSAKSHTRLSNCTTTKAWTIKYGLIYRIRK